MARQGRRLTIGGSGPRLSDDDTLGDKGTGRGETRRYAPPSEDAIRKEAERIGAGASPPATGDSGPVPTIVLPPPEGGGSGEGGPGPTGDAPASTGAGGGPGPGAGAGNPSGEEGSPGPGAPGDAPDYARGGPVKGSTSEHPVNAQDGEWIINKAASEHYGDQFMSLLNQKKVPVMSA